MFKNLNLSEEVLRSLSSSGFENPTEIQAKCIPPIMEGHDVVGRSVTGSGKTLAFGIPIVEMVDSEKNAVQAVVICPTRELAMQVAAEIRKATMYRPGVKIAAIYGGADMGRQIQAVKSAKIIVATPGRLMDHMRRRTVKLDDVKMFVLDEADEMLNMGFRDDIEQILKKAPRERQTVMFSATIPNGIRTIIKEFMKKPEFIEIGAENRTLDNIEQTYMKVVPNGKRAAAVTIFKELKPQSAIVFCNTKRMADEVNLSLNSHGVASLVLHGDMKQSERKRVMTALKTHQANILVATDVAARGIDIEDIEYVVNFDLPDNVEYYLHRIGRTGRAGKGGKALTLISDRRELAILNLYAKETGSNITESVISQDSEIFNPPKKRSYYSSMKKAGSLNPHSSFRRR